MPITTLRRFCFTLNNYTEEDERRIQTNCALFKYLVYGREKALIHQLYTYKVSAISKNQPDLTELKKLSENELTLSLLKELMRTTRDIVQKMAIFILSESPYDKDKEPTWKRWSGILQTKIWDLKILSKRTSPRISNIIEELELYLISLDQSFKKL